MEHPLSKLALDHWYKVLIAAGSFVFVLNGTGVLEAYPTAATALISLGCVLWGIGEWINHPYQEKLVLDATGRISAKISGYRRNARLAGIVFDISGLGLIAFGIYKLF
ncbi:TPA: hypothetical protein ACTR19_001324 [Yersinia enterocolitica]|uniref:Uncharacterized protein n=2 Tax=Yersinia TaxID=629 RepID=A0AAD2V106_YEREN|nr:MULTISPECIES: hypothetical protein [Yersinia]EKN3386059.1 hypothetical protein [Yersinia enterocolitica]EKN3562491.1 hypothetical protein [Yersinia enterocolitica]EKN3769041.1 hypothetical protein [Yersinia enterocolitica]EKN4083765.1 hypothetical protein [Yersinia enterocolitica]EKN6065491.1 hypothetical protein [Yersinia enterocolitica]